MNLATIISTLSDPPKVQKAVHLALLIPTIMAAATAASFTLGSVSPAAERERAVLVSVAKMMRLLVERGHIPAEMTAGINESAFELYPLIIESLVVGGIIKP